MTFNELIKFMKNRGVSSLADIARELEVSPQSVSNWKGRGQVPYKYVVYIQDKYNIDRTAMYTQNIDKSKSMTDQKNLEYNDVEIYPMVKSPIEEEGISFIYILLGLARHIKLIITNITDITNLPSPPSAYSSLQRPL